VSAERKIIRLNMTDLKVTEQKVPKKYREMGGRWLTDSIVSDEVDPQCHPLGPNNKTVFAPGIVTGTSAPSSGRISVGGKSPLTGGIKEANAGTQFSQKMARLGIHALVVEGQPKEKGKFWLLKLDKEGAELHPADEWTGKGLYEVYPQVLKKYGKTVGLEAIGVAGEMLMANAGVCFNDIDNRPSRYAGRGGLGAVLGSKGLKFIVVDDTGVPDIKIADRSLFNKGTKKLTDAINAHDITKPGGGLNTYGTAVLINVMNEAGGLPTRNFSVGRFEGAAATSGEAIKDTTDERGGAGMTGHPCHLGCIIKCSNVWARPDGSEHVSCIEYESDWAFGANCGIDDLDAIAELIWLCNDYGLDTIEAGGTIAVAMEAGLAEFGDSEKAIELMKEIGSGTPLGRVLGNGAATTGRVYGVVRVPGVKGQNMPAYSPRAVKGIGVTYATTPMGADHTAGYTIAPEILGVGGEAEALDADKAELARGFQEATGFIDTTGYCLFIAFAVLDDTDGLEGTVESCNAVLGTKWTTEDIGRIGSEVLKLELDFNAKAGFTKAHDRLPEFMSYEKLPPHNNVFDVPDEDLDKVHPD
jgi:aldehyde:ferredoxin oxidoreductase